MLHERGLVEINWDSIESCLYIAEGLTVTRDRVHRARARALDDAILVIIRYNRYNRCYRHTSRIRNDRLVAESCIQSGGQNRDNGVRFVIIVRVFLMKLSANRV